METTEQTSQSTAAPATVSNSAAEEAAMETFMREGEERAYALGNRGPIRLDDDGRLHPDIVESYWRHGFYVFEGVLKQDELSEIETDIKDIMDRLPSEQGSLVDHKGRPALTHDLEAPMLFWSKPLGDPWGGTEIANGRHPVKMPEPTAAANAPKEIVYLILGFLQFSDASLRAYGNPKLLSIVEAINGADFVPYTDALFIKEPGRGASVSWHQDGTTLWDSPDWDEGSHGFNMMVQLYGSTPANGVWTVPGTHKLGKVDIKGHGRGSRIAAAARCGTNRVQARRRRDQQPSGSARLIRQHQPGLAGVADVRVPPLALGLRRRAERATSPTLPASMTMRASRNARVLLATPSMRGANAIRMRHPTSISPLPMPARNASGMLPQRNRCGITTNSISAFSPTILWSNTSSRQPCRDAGLRPRPG